MENFGFMQVLEGFGNIMLYFLRFWNVSDGNLWFYVGFKRLLKPNVVFIQVLEVLRWNRLVYQRFWKVWMSKRTTRAYKPFNFIIKSMPCEPFWSSRRPGAPELPKHYFSLSNRWCGKHFGAKGARRPPELPNKYFSL